MNSKLISYNLEFKQFGKEAILIEWPQIISENVLKSVLSYKQKLENFNFKQFVPIFTSYIQRIFFSIISNTV